MSLDPLQTLLLQILSLNQDKPTAHTLSQLPANQWQSLLKLADGLHVTPLLYTRLKQKGASAPPTIQQKIHKSYLNNTGRNLTIFHAFRQLATQLQAANIPMIPLKGVYLADAVYPTLGERIIGDLDLLVPKERIVEAVEIGISSNFHPIMPVVLDAWLKTKHHTCPQFNANTQLTVEWHWHIFKPSLQKTIPVNSLWQRAVPATISEQSVRTLTPEDTIFHLAYHMSYHHEFLFGIRNLSDLSWVCQKYAETIDWGMVGRYARRAQFERGIYLALMLARTYLAAPIPEPFLDTLKPASFSPDHLGIAAQQVFVVYSQITQASKTWIMVQGSHGLMNKVRALHQAVFLSSEQMATRYGIQPSSQSTLGRYLFRWRSLAQQALDKIKPSLKGKTAVSAALKRKSHLAAWLNTPE